MSNLTRGKVAYNFQSSPYTATIGYGDDDYLKFVFSSELYKSKFLSRIGENRNVINDSLSKRFGFNIKNNRLADIRLYASIEKRGFLIYKGPVKIECLNNIILDGQLLMKKH